MTKDLKQGLALGVAFAALVSVMPSKAQDKILDEDLCEKAVSYSVKYLPEEDDAKLHRHDGTSSRGIAQTILRN